MKYEDIQKIQLDPDDDEALLQQAFLRVKAASNNRITDFTLGSPVSALLEGQVFAMAELFWYLNQLPEALAIEVFRLAGIQRSLGTKATGDVTVLLNAPLRDAFIISAGYQIPYKDSYFVTTEQLVIPAGAISGDVAIEAATEGSSFNVAAYGLVVPNPGLAYVQSIYNLENIVGGSDLEPLDTLVKRAQFVLRSREVLVSKEDFEQAAQDLLGAGSRASCVPLLMSNKETKAPGQVHLFLVDGRGEPPSLATCNTIKNALQERSFAASSVWVSPVNLEPVYVEVTATTEQISIDLANRCYEALKEYVNPSGTYPLGGSLFINELEYIFRTVAGITRVESVLIDGQPLNRAMPNLYSTPLIDTLAVSLVQPDSVNYTYYLGNGTGDTD
ncbi:baseplate J/gp47 family protein [Floridanema aerugineum]|uniref:Baseplate J/gp47 family protein n=1 Tax=Floridaenema aerugineum BLCC-F46 TaxID=3153654 RepID=A0ABV4X279_9CYAN